MLFCQREWLHLTDFIQSLSWDSVTCCTAWWHLVLGQSLQRSRWWHLGQWKCIENSTTTKLHSQMVRMELLAGLSDQCKEMMCPHSQTLIGSPTACKCLVWEYCWFLEITFLARWWSPSLSLVWASEKRSLAANTGTSRHLCTANLPATQMLQVTVDYRCLWEVAKWTLPWGTENVLLGCGLMPKGNAFLPPPFWHRPQTPRKRELTSTPKPQIVYYLTSSFSSVNWIARWSHVMLLTKELCSYRNWTH